jgi:hypothetical protein
LGHATAELQGRVAQLIMSVSEGYFLAYSDTAFSSSTTRYRIPDRAMLGKLREAYVVDSAGEVLEQLAQAPLESLGDGLGDFYVEGEHLVFLEARSSDYLRMFYYRRPSALVATSAVATVSSFDSGTKTITTAATIPGTFSTSVTMDIVRAKPGFSCLAVDQVPTVASGTTITLTDALPTDLAAGDYVTLAGESPVPQIPVELHPLLSQATVLAALEARGDQAGVAAAGQKYSFLEKAALQQLESRVEGAPAKLVYFNPLFSGVRRWR